ncbi:MAG: amino acid ABC transporter ATP-binding protein [Vulcanimicrobiota bacterium]
MQLAARGIHKNFGDLEVLRGVDLEVAQGEVVTLIGPSGSGKSTLLRCLNLLEIPNQGSLFWEGEQFDFRTCSEAALARHRTRMGMVFQHFHLFPHLTALENVTEAPRQVLGLTREEARGRAAELLARVGLAEKESAHPSQLSGGQKQRVAIARALAMQPKALLLDEVTSALDVEMVAGINQLLGELAESMTMVVVTHDLGFASKVSDRICFMDKGRLLETGPPSEVLDSPASPRAREFLSALR